MMFGLKDRVLAMIGGGLSILLAAALAYVWITSGATIREVRGQLTTAQADLKAARDDLTQCRANRITLEEANRLRNEAVDKARSESAGRIAELQRAAARAEGTATEARRAADRILAAKGTGDVCADADALIFGEVK